MKSDTRDTDASLTTMPHSSPRKVSRKLLGPQSKTSVFRVSPCFTMFSRSIASSASVPDRQDHSYLSQVQEEPISQLENFRKRLQNINNSYNLTDLSELWDSFSSVLDSGVPKQINTNEVIRLSWLLLNNKVLLYSPDLSQRRFWSERLQRVHVLLKKRKYHFQPEGEK